MLHGGEIYDKTIKYDFSVNTNPYPCPEGIKDILIETVFSVEKYPDMEQREFRDAVAKAENISPDMIIGGNGASELFAALVHMLRPRMALLPVPSFWGYEHALGMLDDCQIEYYYLSEERDFEITEDFLDSIDGSTDALFLANPNNPTGRCIKREVLEKIIRKCQDTGTKLIVDECFFNLSDGDTSSRDYIQDYAGLYVIDAYTKLYSIPGVRVGFLLTQSQNIQNIKRYLPEWNMSLFALRAGAGCARFNKKGYVEKSLDYIRKERAYLEKELAECGIRTYKSDTNFLLIKSRDDLYEKLLKKEILIRDCSNFMGLEKGYYRIAVSSHEENKILINGLREL